MQVNSKGCILFKDENYTLSDLKDATDIAKKLKIKPHAGVQFTYDFFIKEMIKKLTLKKKLVNQLKEVNGGCSFKFVSVTMKDREQEFNQKATEELECVYDVGSRKEDGIGGFSTWKADVETDERIISLYEKVNSMVEDEFASRKGAPHSLLLNLCNNADSCRLKEKSKDYVSFMKMKAWHMFPYHTICEILTLIEESSSTKKQQLTDLFKKVLTINKSIATEPNEKTKSIAYELKECNGTKRRTGIKTRNSRGKKAKINNGTFCYIFCYTFLCFKFYVESHTQFLSLFFIENESSLDDITFIETTFKQNEKNQSPSKQIENRDVPDDLSSNTPLSINSFATPTQLDTNEGSKIPACTPDSYRHCDTFSKTPNEIDTVQKPTNSAKMINPYKKSGKLSNDLYNLIDCRVDEVAIQSYQSKKSMSTKMGNRIDFMTSKPLRTRDGNVKILFGLTGSVGTNYLGKSMFSFQGDEFHMMCKFLRATNRTLGGNTKYCHEILDACKHSLVAISNPGTNDNTPIGDPNYPKKVAVGVLTFNNGESNDEIKKIVEELKIGIESILHDENFFTWYLVGVWIKTEFRQNMETVTNQEILLEYLSMRKDCNNNITEYFTNGSDSNYLKKVANDQFGVMKSFNGIPICHMKDVPLDLWFLESSIVEIVPKFIGTYEKKYEEFIIADTNKHGDDFLMYH